VAEFYLAGFGLIGLREKKIVSKEVYSPAEDSWLLEGVILGENLRGKICLDVGCGSGIQSVALLRAGAAKVLAVDINEEAVKVTQKNVGDFLKKNKRIRERSKGLVFGVMQGDLFSSIKDKFDVIVFNPPYVPSDGEKWTDLDGGKDGRKVIDKFIKQVGKRLNKEGFVLLLVSTLNHPQEIEQLLFDQGFAVKVSAQKKLFFEELLVFKAKKLF
jgi:release factor glutamine methyltransferase